MIRKRRGSNPVGNYPSGALLTLINLTYIQ